MKETLGIQIGGFFVAYYGMMIILGLAAASIVGWYQVRRYGKNIDEFILLAAIGGLCGLVGAKLLYLLVSFREIDFGRLDDLDYLNQLMSGGFVFYGGVLGAAGGLVFCRKKLHIEVLAYLQICIACIPLAHGFGRIGCSLVGCCYGIPYSGIFAQVYHNSLFAPNNIALFPVQRLEAVLEIALAVVLLVFQKKLSGTKGLELYLVCYALMRFGLEFLRADGEERGMLGWISTSQIISLLLLTTVVIYHIYTRRKRRIAAPCPE